MLPELHCKDGFSEVCGGLEVCGHRALTVRHESQEQQRDKSIRAARAFVCQERFAQRSFGLACRVSCPVDTEPFERFRALKGTTFFILRRSF